MSYVDPIYNKLTFKGTKEEFDQLPSDGKYYCPNCGLGITQPYPGCGCPQMVGPTGYSFARHINKYHHDCEKAWKQAYEKR
jgi:hypothetical protein